MNATSVVLKFGSSVLADRHCLPRVVHEICRYCRRGHHVLAVVSAQAGLLSSAGIKLMFSGECLDAWPTSVDTQVIRQAFQMSPVLVLPGFACVQETGGMALMGRGGTDLTAVFLAQALDAAECCMRCGRFATRWKACWCPSA